MTFPHDAGFFRVLVPPESIDHPSRSDNIRRAVMIHVKGPLAAVGDELPEHPYRSVLMALPLAARRTRILVPVGTTQDVRAAVAIHVECGDAFCMIGAEAVNEKSELGNATGPIPGHGFSSILRPANRSAHGYGKKDCKSSSEQGQPPLSFSKLRASKVSDRNSISCQLHRIGIPFDYLAPLYAQIAEQRRSGCTIAKYCIFHDGLPRANR